MQSTLILGLGKLKLPLLGLRVWDFACFLELYTQYSQFLYRYIRVSMFLGTMCIKTLLLCCPKNGVHSFRTPVLTREPSSKMLNCLPSCAAQRTMFYSFSTSLLCCPEHLVPSFYTSLLWCPENLIPSFSTLQYSCAAQRNLL